MEITEQLTLLAELSSVEARMRALNNKLETLPAEAKAAQATADTAKKAFDVVDQDRLNVDKERVQLERQLNECKDHLKKWRLRLEKIRDEREHGALLTEIGGQKRQITRLENDILERMEIIENHEKDGASKKEAWEQAQNLADVEFAKVEADVASAKAQLTQEEASRDALVGKLPAALVKKYNRIAEARKGMGVAVITGEICGACNTHIPPQLVLQVYKGALLEGCPSCSRILVHEAMTRSEATAAAEAAGA